MKKQKGINLEETFKQGVGGGILGAFVGAPGLGMTLGVLHANRGFIKDGAQQVDNSFKKPLNNTKRLKPRTVTLCSKCGNPTNNCQCTKRAMDNPAAFLR